METLDFVNDIEKPLLNAETVDTAHVQRSDVERHLDGVDVFTTEILDDTGALLERPTHAVAENELLREMQQDPEIEILGVSNDHRGGFTAELRIDVLESEDHDGIGVQIVFAEGDMLSIHRLQEGSGRLDWWDLNRDSVDGYGDLLSKIYVAVMPF